MQSGTMVCAVALIATGVMGVAFSPRATQLEAAPQIVIGSDDPLPDPPVLQSIEPAAHASRAARDLFGYVEPAPRAAAAETVEPEPVAAPAAAEIEVVAPPPVARPQFPYRYIGRFGHDAHPIAAFVRDGEVVTVHAGERVGGWMVKAIERESVQVEADGEVVRVRL